jgi:hypothetical protein
MSWSNSPFCERGEDAPPNLTDDDHDHDHDILVGILGLGGKFVQVVIRGKSLSKKYNMSLCELNESGFLTLKLRREDNTAYNTLAKNIFDDETVNLIYLQ